MDEELLPKLKILIGHIQRTRQELDQESQREKCYQEQRARVEDEINAFKEQLDDRLQEIILVRHVSSFGSSFYPLRSPAHGLRGSVLALNRITR